MEDKHRIVIIGGGFGGLYCARSLRKAPARITLVDRRNFHLFQPLLYQVATGGLSPANIASPLRGVLRRQRNTNVVMADVTDIDVTNHRLILRDEEVAELSYDTLVVATGSQFNYFGHDEWAAHAPGLKTIEDAVAIRRRVLTAFERAELETDPVKQKACITFVVVGAGPTGVEMAGALGEVAHHTLSKDFRNVRPGDATILLLEAQSSLLGTFPPDLQRKAAESLKRLGVTVRLGTAVTAITPQGVEINTGTGSETISAGTVLWTAGVKASPLGAKLAAATDAKLDRAGRLIVERDLTLAGHQEIFVVGDLANFSHQTGQPLPGLAPVAMQQGRFVADVIRGRLVGKEPPRAFHYIDKGTLATIGRGTAVADLGRFHLSGHLAWFTWLFIHLMFLIQFQNRVLVLMQWAFSYFTRGRSARLITEGPFEPPGEGRVES